MNGSKIQKLNKMRLGSFGENLALVKSNLLVSLANYQMPIIPIINAIVIKAINSNYQQLLDLSDFKHYQRNYQLPMNWEA